MSYQEKITAARRLAILLALYFAPGYTMNRAALKMQVEATGYVASNDLFYAELAWLDEVGLIEFSQPIAKLTDRGADVALGKSQTPGVRRPSPGETDGPQ